MLLEERVKEEKERRVTKGQEETFGVMAMYIVVMVS